jgi:hypothetical protein
MKKNITELNIFKRIMNFLSHPAWNGVSCIFTVLATLGLGGIVLTFIIVMFRQVQELASWFLQPIIISRYVIICVSIILLALIIKTIQQLVLSNRKSTAPGKFPTIFGSKTTFIPISFSPGIGNSYLKDRYISPPSGDVVFAGSQFKLNFDSMVFDTSKQIRDYLPLDSGGKEIVFHLPESVNKIKSVNFLINSGNSKTIYLNRSIGKISLMFKEAPPIVVELILGKNVREWCPGNSGDYIRETSSADNVNAVWVGMSKNGANAVIDCLKISVFECMRNCYLEKFIFTHQSIIQPPDTMGVHYSVLGVSLELYQVA